MVKIVHTTGFLACLAMAALVGACGDDDGGDNKAADAGAPDGSNAVTYGFAMTKGAEVPLCTGGGVAAGGTASVMINAAGTEITVMANFSGLSAAATMAHIHYGTDTAMGPVVLNFASPPTTPMNKTFTAADYPATPPSGAPANFAAFVSEMKAGKTYINVHTGTCPGGEIRGQIR